MIRPFTFLCFLLACGSGLYLYQSKHRVQMLDRQIEQTVHATEAARDQARLLNAEWMLLNDPDRLRQLADQFLALRTVTPGQFTSLADLDHRLPPVRSADAPVEKVPEPAVMTPMVPVAQAAPTAPPTATAQASTAPSSNTPSSSPPPSAKPSSSPASATQPAPRPAPAPLVAERRPATPTRLASAQPETRQEPARPEATHQELARADVARPEPRLSAETHRTELAAAAPRRVRLSAPIAPVAMPVQGGSVLGMASHSNLPPPVAPKVISLFPPLDTH